MNVCSSIPSVFPLNLDADFFMVVVDDDLLLLFFFFDHRLFVFGFPSVPSSASLVAVGVLPSVLSLASAIVLGSVVSRLVFVCKNDYNNNKVYSTL